MSRKTEEKEPTMLEEVTKTVETTMRRKIEREQRPRKYATRYLATAIKELTYGYERDARKNIKNAVQVLDGKEVDC